MNSLGINDRVRILHIPEQIASDRDKFPETYDLLKLAVEEIYSVRSFNEHNMVEIWLNDDATEDTQGIHHSIWIEQEHLERISPPTFDHEN